MKKNKKLILFFGLFLVCQVAFSQPSPPGDAGQGTGPVGGGAPIENGVWILIGLGAIYASTRIYFICYNKIISEQE
jgi:hypothetical protein